MPQAIADLFDKYLNNNCSPREVSELMRYFHTIEAKQLDQLILAELEQDNVEAREGEYKEILDRVFVKIDQEIVVAGPAKAKKLWPRFAAAASIILGLGFGGYFLLHKKAQQPIAQNVQFKKDLSPGGTKAYLTLANGHRIALSDTTNGKIAIQSGVVITKTGDGQLVYQAAPAVNPGINTEPAYNMIETPKGGQYRVVLPDGTQVWLNAASSLKYPARFAGNERKVELTGEGYFEVVHNSRQPFKVTTNGLVVEDLGTHFNINCYTDEPAALTTLLEGAVKVNGKTTLHPGEQAQLMVSGTLAVRTVDTDEAVAWKNGVFMFSNESLGSIMRKIGRWYNTDITFSNEQLKQVTFSGTISRLDNVSKVLRRLALTNEATFSIENNRIIIGSVTRN